MMQQHKKILSLYRFLLVGISAITLLLNYNQGAFARVSNPAIDPKLGATGDPAAVLGQFISSWWGTMYMAGGIAFILYLSWGGLEWTIAGGDEERVKSAKNKISNAMFGLALLAGSFAIVKAVSYLFGIDLFTIDISKLAPGP